MNKREQHLNLVLRAIRNVNQLITREQEKELLLQKACDILIKVKGYTAILIHYDGRIFQAGDRKECKKLKKKILGEKVLQKRKLHAESFNGKYLVISPIIKNTIKATLYVLHSRIFDREELSLLKEISGDLAFALHSIKLECEKREAEKTIKESLQEKEVLLKEIHHRVKNNMQIISSLLNLQIRHSADGKITTVLRHSQNRIRTMALIHEKLYESKDLTHVDCEEYVKDLSKQLMLSYGISRSRIKLNINIKNIYFDINTAIPCALIINELLSNALKYAFPRLSIIPKTRRQHKIDVILRKSKKNLYTLIIRDNGVGIPQHITLNSLKTLGLQLVKTLVEQLNGTIKLERKGGTKFTITFEKIK